MEWKQWNWKIETILNLWLFRSVKVVVEKIDPRDIIPRRVSYFKVRGIANSCAASRSCYVKDRVRDYPKNCVPSATRIYIDAATDMHFLAKQGSRRGRQNVCCERRIPRSLFAVDISVFAIDNEHCRNSWLLILVIVVVEVNSFYPFFPFRFLYTEKKISPTQTIAKMINIQEKPIQQIQIYIQNNFWKPKKNFFNCQKITVFWLR